MIPALLWRRRRRRARRYARYAYLAYRRRPCKLNQAALVRAEKLVQRVEWGRP